MKKNLLITCSFFILIAGCQKKQEFTCESEPVKNQVISMSSTYFNKFVSQPGFFTNFFNAMQQFQDQAGVSGMHEYQKDYENIVFTLEDIRTVKQNKELGNYECKANLSARKDSDSEAKIEITYTSESTNGGKDSYIQVGAIKDRDIGTLASVLIKEKTLVKKSTTGEISYGTLDSSVGDFSFISNSEIGKKILSECGIGEICEVNAYIDEYDIIRKLIYAKKI